MATTYERSETLHLSAYGVFEMLLDIMFASVVAVDDARRALGRFWDSSEVYAVVGELDANLRAAGFRALRWQQTAPYHWCVVARR